MENKDLEFDYFDPMYSEYQPLRDDVRKEIQNIQDTLKNKKKENFGFSASLIRKMMPCNLMQDNL